MLWRMDDVLHAVEDDGPRAPDVQKALHAQHVLATGVKQHAEPDPERRPVDGAVERHRDGMRVPDDMSIAGLQGRVLWRRPRSPMARREQVLHVHHSESRLLDLRRGVYGAETRQQALYGARLCQIR